MAVKRLITSFLISLVVFLLVGIPHPAVAQQRKLSGLLFSSKALDRATNVQDKKVFADKFNWRLDSLGLFAAVGDSLRFDAVDEVGIARERRTGTFAMYRGIYNRYDSAARSAWHVYDETDQLDDLAERVALYQGVSEMGGYVLRSSFGPLVLDTIRGLANLREYVTFKVARRNDGSLRFGNGRSKFRTMEFSFATSTRRGLEPRLRLYENIMLKYDIFEQQPLLEYTVNF